LDNSGRRLAAILAADIAGYSRLMGLDEAATVRDLKAHLAVVLPMIGQYGGQVVDLAGDGILAEFHSAVRAVECAVAIQQIMAERNLHVPADRQMLLRIGINLGDILHEGTHIYGDGVNIAARLQALAEPGSLCLSRDIHSQVCDKVHYPFADLGEHNVRNIARPIRTFGLSGEDIGTLPRPPIDVPAQAHGLSWRLAASAIACLALLLVGAFAVWLYRPPAADTRVPAATAATTGRPAIAVLPFVTLGNDPGDSYFGDGLTEDIIAALGRFPELSVLSGKAVFPYKNKTQRPEEIGRELGARYIVEGNVRRTPERLRISVQLSDASRGLLLWSDQYESVPKDVFTIQDSITRNIAGALAVRLTKLEQDRIALKPTSSLEAYDLVLRGRDLASRLQRLANAQARGMFEQAIALDPTYGAAYVGLSSVDLTSAALGWTEDPMAALQRSEALAKKAIGLDDGNASAHAVLGSAYVLLRQFDRGIDELHRAIELNPSNADSHEALADALLTGGEIEASIESSELALRLNPNLNVGELWTLAMGYFLADRNADATRILERAVTRDASFVYGHVMLAALYAEAGRVQDVADTVAKVRRLDPLFDAAVYPSQFRNREHQAKIAAALKMAGF
jgi:adenylate cyclase